MCFSLEADVVVGVALIPLGVASLREVRTAREVPFAVLPLLFAAHQLIEAVVWLGLDGRVSPAAGARAVLAYLVVAFSVLPVMLPLSVLLLEPRGARLRVAPFLALGIVVAGYLGSAIASGPVEVVEHPHALAYVIGLSNGGLWVALYVAAVIGPPLLSGYPSIVAFGVLNLIGLTLVAVLLEQYLASVWCIYAALLSALVVVAMRRRRRLPDPHRLQGAPSARFMAGL